VLFIDEDDPHVNELGSKGIGELRLTGSWRQSATPSTRHAPTKRFRDLPITIDKLL
jgi:xanthine dehydrogenase YagR molybdenum-binding subunit